MADDTQANDRPPFILTSADKATGLWARLESHLQDEVEKLRRQNDGDLTDIQTAKLRGRIAELSRLLRLGKEMPPVED